MVFLLRNPYPAVIFQHSGMINPQQVFSRQIFKLNKLLINEAEDTIEAGLEEESEVLFGQGKYI